MRGVGFLFSRLTASALRFAIKNLRDALWRGLEVLMPAIASLEDLEADQKDLVEAKDPDELKRVFKKSGE